jgi:hypothetical protein
MIEKAGGLEIEVVRTRGLSLCAYCFAVLCGEDADRIPEIKANDIRRAS